MNVAIIGCGYVGTAVARLWQQQGLTVTATTTKGDRTPELEAIAAQVLVLQGDDQAALQSALQDQQTVLLSIGAANSKVYEATYLRTAETLAQVLPRCPNLQQLIYTSSYSVYGDHQGAWVDEDTPIEPTNANTQILAKTEQVLLNATQPGLNICVFRLGGIFGPGRELVKIFRRVPGTTRPGNGSSASNWVHLDDIVGAIDFAHTHQLQGIYNLVLDAPPTSRELLAQICHKYDLPPVSWDPSLPGKRANNVRLSNRKLKTSGYEFIHSEISI
ncbi:MAG: SDR family oxidoreductase [Cyanothece sp. SIO1E1]|nr:SDR family oxidoreductase [Cyanothece sp. SIO1E1]